MSYFLYQTWKYRMHTAMTVAVSAALMVVLNGRAEAGTTCISKATEALPRIAGLVVKKPRTPPLPPAIPASCKGRSRPAIIDVDGEMPGEAPTYSFMCVVTQGSAFVQRTMKLPRSCQR